MQSLFKLGALLSAHGTRIGAGLIGLSTAILLLGVVDFVLRRVLGLPKDAAFYLAVLGLSSLSALAFRLHSRRVSAATPTGDAAQED